jgi:hypothetical protein
VRRVFAMRKGKRRSSPRPPLSTFQFRPNGTLTPLSPSHAPLTCVGRPKPTRPRRLRSTIQTPHALSIPWKLVVVTRSLRYRSGGEFIIGPLLKVIGWLATAAMALAAIGMFATCSGAQ